ncbi:GATA transcription factor 17-like isoform X2 [Lolium rigidum]|uniref:GATA transcription factor 17-like isoform X2 n=1 Tax=Lolium rigidum TaxID=89674 RepID=UPI001F5D4C2B|nr:GATA transcription factor 17-like isoform X2 [Lolium rigidum]
MSGHHDATKPYQPRRGPERPPPEQPVGEEEAAAAAAMAELQPEPGPMEQYEPHLEHEEEGEEEEEEEEEEGEEEEGEEGIEYGYDYGTGEAISMDAEGAAAAAAAAGQHEAMAPTAGVQQPLPQTLTLSFQGEAFVFENVSAEKVQAVLLLLGGKELPPGSIPGPSSSSPYRKAINFSHRMESLMRFREKRKERNFDKKIRYSVRKEVAHRMKRHKGQFTSSKAKAEEGTSGVTNSDGSTNWGAVEDRPQSASVCQHCGISSTLTPMMRKGPNGTKTLCNACGLMWANKGFLRDVTRSPHVPLQVVPPATNDANGTAGAPISEQETLALEAPPPAPAPAPAPDANGHDS